MAVEVQERITGAVLGLAVGDALGVPVEFQPREALRREPVIGMRGFGSHRQPPGIWSDDTSLAMCLLESLLDAGFSRRMQAGASRPDMTPTTGPLAGWYFFKRQLINERLAHNMLQRDHSGFSVDGSVRIPVGSSRTLEALSQYIARAPVSLNKLIVEEHAATVLYRTAYNPYFRTNLKTFRATDFIAELLQHLPDPRLRLIRRYGLYSSRSRGTWLRNPHLVRLAPEGWRQDHSRQWAFPIGPVDEGNTETSLTARQSRASWPPPG